MQKYEENLASRLSGNALQPLALVEVRVTDDATGLPAALYSDDGVTPLPQPMITDNNGGFAFYAANGEYTLTFSGASIATFTRKVILDDPSENKKATVAQLAAPSGSALVGFISPGVGAVARTIQDVAREAVSVKDFGAKGDGSTDDLSAIIAARDYCITTRAELVFPGGTNSAYAHSATINFGFTGLRVRFEGGAKLKHTGAGVALALDAGEVAQVYDIHVKNPSIEGNAATTDALLVRGCHHIKVPNLNARNFSGAALRTKWCIEGDFPNLTCSSNESAFTVTPTAGIVLDKRGPGEYTVGVMLSTPTLEGINGVGIDIVDGSNNTVIGGTSEANSIGIRTSSISHGNRFAQIWCEANSVNDAVIEGRGNVLDNVDMLSSAMTNNVEIVAADSTMIMGGRVRCINRQALSTNTSVIGSRVSDNPALGIKGEGTGITLGVVKVDANGSGTSTVSDSFPRIEYMTGTWVGALQPSTSGTIVLNASFKTGSYTKIGRSVTVTGIFYVDSVASPVGDLFLTGLPFPAAAGQHARAAVSVNADNLAPTANGSIVGMIEPSGSRIIIRKFANGIKSHMAADVQANADFYISATYIVD